MSALDIVLVIHVIEVSFQLLLVCSHTRFLSIYLVLFIHIRLLFRSEFQYLPRPIYSNKIKHNSSRHHPISFRSNIYFLQFKQLRLPENASCCFSIYFVRESMQLFADENKVIIVGIFGSEFVFYENWKIIKAATASFLFWSRKCFDYFLENSRAGYSSAANSFSDINCSFLSCCCFFFIGEKWSEVKWTRKTYERTNAHVSMIYRVMIVKYVCRIFAICEFLCDRSHNTFNLNPFHTPASLMGLVVFVFGKFAFTISSLFEDADVK